MKCCNSFFIFHNLHKKKYFIAEANFPPNDRKISKYEPCKLYFVVFLCSSERVGIFSFDHERLLDNKNILEELQKQNY